MNKLQELIGFDHPDYTQRKWRDTVKCKNKDHFHRAPRHGYLYTHSKCGASRIVDVEAHEAWHAAKDSNDGTPPT